VEEIVREKREEREGERGERGIFNESD